MEFCAYIRARVSRCLFSPQCMMVTRAECILAFFPIRLPVRRFSATKRVNRSSSFRAADTYDFIQGNRLQLYEFLSDGQYCTACGYACVHCCGNISSACFLTNDLWSICRRRYHAVHTWMRRCTYIVCINPFDTSPLYCFERRLARHNEACLKRNSGESHGF